MKIVIKTLGVLVFAASACAQEPSQKTSTETEALPAFTSVPSLEVRDCIIEAAGIAEAISDYDELDRDFLVSYASTLSLDELSEKTKGERTYSDDLNAEELARLLTEAKKNRTCRELQ